MCVALVGIWFSLLSSLLGLFPKMKEDTRTKEKRVAPNDFTATPLTAQASLLLGTGPPHCARAPRRRALPQCAGARFAGTRAPSPRTRSPGRAGPAPGSGAGPECAAAAGWSYERPDWAAGGPRR